MPKTNSETKMMLLGPDKVGKLSITVRLEGGEFPDDDTSASYTASTHRFLATDSTTKPLWERFSSIYGDDYSSIGIAALVVDITKPLADCQDYIDRINKAYLAKKILVVNKIDLVDQRQLTDEDIATLQRKLGDAPVIRVSAKTKQGIEALRAKLREFVPKVERMEVEMPHSRTMWGRAPESEPLAGTQPSGGCVIL